MAEPPMQPGTRLQLARVDGTYATAVVTTILATDARDPRRRWRLLCRWVDGAFIHHAIHCDDAGNLQLPNGLTQVPVPHGRHHRPAGDIRPGA